MAMGIATTPFGDEDDFEVVNDEGFVYKRKRRRIDLVVGDSVPSPAAADPEAEERDRGERKRRVLLKLRNQYLRELEQWESLSNAVKEMEEESLQHLREPEGDSDRTESCAGSSSGSGKENEGACGTVVDELLRQVEAQGAMICDLSNVCDIVEAMCNAEDEPSQQYLIDLPIWASPAQLMALLCEE